MGWCAAFVLMRTWDLPHLIGNLLRRMA